MIAHALLAVIAAIQHERRPNPTGDRTHPQRIRYLFKILIVEPARVIACLLLWSRW